MKRCYIVFRSASIVRSRTLVVGAILALGCTNVPSSDGYPGSSNSNGSAADIAQYKALQTQLDARRTKFLDKSATAIQGIGHHLFWLEYPTIDATLHSYDARTNAKINYTFGINENCEASDTGIATAAQDGANTRFGVYDTGASSSSLENLEIPGPTDEQRWWAYAVDGRTLYYATTSADDVRGSASADVVPRKSPMMVSDVSHVVRLSRCI
ncbi:MAG TPA: hypothetical protein VNO21_19575 [Polyangiaceae bacterium]|nr:hypothetical protein [Polyangiaceae bacterium]